MGTELQFEKVFSKMLVFHLRSDGDEGPSLPISVGDSNKHKVLKV